MKVLRNNFTLLEMLIAVIILVIVSSVVVGVFRNTLENYKKGMSYSEITEGISGVYMIMRNDLSRMRPIGDKKNVFFKADEFSFVCIAETESKKSYLELICYKFDHDTLMRGSVNYPEEIDKMSQDMFPFLKGVKEMNFSYVFEKKERKKKKNDKKSSSSHNNSDETKKENKIKNTAENDKKNKVKLPLIVNLTATLENKKIEEHFSTALCATFINTVPGTGTGSDSDKKDDASSDSTNQLQNR